MIGSKKNNQWRLVIFFYAGVHEAPLVNLKKNTLFSIKITKFSNFQINQWRLMDAGVQIVHIRTFLFLTFFLENSNIKIQKKISSPIGPYKNIKLTLE